MLPESRTIKNIFFLKSSLLYLFLLLATHKTVWYV